MIYVLTADGDIYHVIQADIDVEQLSVAINEHNEIISNLSATEFDVFPEFPDWLRNKGVEVTVIDYTQVSLADGYIY